MGKARVKGTVLVTGGTRRIGKVIADTLRNAGWRVLTSSHREDSGADFIQDLSDPAGAVNRYDQFTGSRMTFVNKRLIIIQRQFAYKQICIIFLTYTQPALLFDLITKRVFVHVAVLQTAFGQTEFGAFPDAAAADKRADQYTAAVNFLQ